MTPATNRLAAAISGWQAAVPGVLTVAVDGPGASGKSTIAAAVAGTVGAALVHTDDFFQRPPGPGPHRVERYYDWRRIAAGALEPLRAGRPARFRRFEWAEGAGGPADEAQPPGGFVTVPPRPVVILEGVFASAPELAGLIDRTVLVDTPEAERIRRLRRRITEQEWDDDWLAAERVYFSETRPPCSFGLVVGGGLRVLISATLTFRT